MKYTIETTENGCIETLEFSNGNKYERNHKKTVYGSSCADEEFHEQMESDGINEDVLNKVYDVFDSFLANDFMYLAQICN